MGNAIKYLLAAGILGVAGYTTFRGQGWWWKLPVKTRIIAASVVTLGIVAAGYMYEYGPR